MINAHRDHPMRYSVVTFGCRVNQADSLRLEEELRARGGVAVPPSEADIVIVNTCSVTASADQGARQTVRRVARDNPSASLVVTGCYATRRPDDVAALPNVTHVVINDNKARLIPLVLDSELSTAERFGGGPGSCGATIEPGMAGRTAYTLRVQTGCAELCSYCIIPTTRGRPASVPIASVLADVDRVSAAGFKELAITGVHLGSYGRDLSPASSLFELLRALARTTSPQNDLLFRISSLEPMDCTNDIVELVASSGCFAPHFHLPLQHASDGVLARMRRPYTIEQYATLVDRIRARIPHASIGSDVIAGFPGETDDDFEELVSYLERSPLTHLHVFPYSDRPGTRASAMESKVAGAVIRDRARRLRQIGQQLAVSFRLGQLGTTHRALTIDDGSTAVTGNYLKVTIPQTHARNEWVTIRVADAADTVRGELVAD